MGTRSIRSRTPHLHMSGEARKPHWQARATRPVALLVAVLIFLALSGTSQGLLERPSYAPGDRWVYVLEGLLDALPGPDFNGSSAFSLTLEGRIEVEVHEILETNVEGRVVGAVRTTTLVTGFLNGTFTIPGGPLPVPASVTGSFRSDVSELWEDRGYFAIESHGLSTYAADVTYILTTRFEVEMWSNATTVPTLGTMFPLDVGESASASLRTDLAVNSTVTIAGQRVTVENRTSVTAGWSRTVLAQESVSVEAGTFPVYRVNQSLSSFPGIAGADLGASGNETAYFSNDVGYYVKRVAYVNGSPVAEMRLKSYSRAAEGGLISGYLILMAILVVAAVVVTLWLHRRRRNRVNRAELTEEPSSGPGVGADGGPRDGQDDAR